MVDEAPDHGELAHQWRLTKHLLHSVYVASIADASLAIFNVDNEGQEVLEPNNNDSTIHCIWVHLA